MTDRASIARPGFHKALFGHDPSQVDAVIQDLQDRVETAERDAQVAHARIRELEEVQSQKATPSFDELGGRLVAILSLAEEEAAEQRGAAEMETRRHREEAVAAAKTIRADADRYAEGVRKAADAEAAKVLEEARGRANEVLEDAEREASARRAEAEALFETHLANAAAAAADLERSLAARRDEAASEIAAQLAVHEDSLQAAEERAVQLAEQSEAAFEEARGIANAHIAQAEEQAALILQRARAQADRITRNSEREVTAASARRDSINVQLDNLRQMLATLGGPGVAEQLLGKESAAPLTVGSPSGGGDADGRERDHSAKGPNQGSETDQPLPAQERPGWYETLQNVESSAVPGDSPVVEATEGEAGGAGSQAAAHTNPESLPKVRKTPPAPGRRNTPA
jgi:cell division septum initiation protein DivIVA